MLNFTFEESQLLINFFKDVEAVDLTKGMIYVRLKNAILNTEDEDLVNIANNVINKIFFMSDEDIKYLPILFNEEEILVD